MHLKPICHILLENVLSLDDANTLACNSQQGLLLTMSVLIMNGKSSRAFCHLYMYELILLKCIRVFVCITYVSVCACSYMRMYSLGMGTYSTMYA